MARLVLNLAQDESTGLINLAMTELRDPHDQLRYILRHELSCRGLLKECVPPSPTPRRDTHTPCQESEIHDGQEGVTK